jgi:phosphohistidine phosphatase
MECILFRHGIAVERADWDGEESLRPLTPKGAEKTREAAAGLLRLELEPGYLWTSPLARGNCSAHVRNCRSMKPCCRKPHLASCWRCWPRCRWIPR